MKNIYVNNTAAAKKKIHLMSALGGSDKGYDEGVYVWGEGEREGRCKNRFVQIAGLEKIMQENPKADIRVSILLTNFARKMSWEDRKIEIMQKITPQVTGNEKQLLDKLARKHPKLDISFSVKKSVTCTGLESEFKRTIAEARKRYPDCNIRYEAIDIPDGKDKDEQDEIFDRMYQSIEENETLCFDLTHGFRSIPILALTILNYARITKHVEVGGLFYGAYEGRRKNGDVPYIDMSYCDSVLEWTSAAEAFIKSGSSRQIREIYEKKGRKSDTGVRDVVESLYDLTNCLEASRGSARTGRNQNTRNSIQSAYNQFTEAVERVKESEGLNQEQKPLVELFAVIGNDTQVFGNQLISEDTEEGNFPATSVGIAAVSWALKKGLVQQGLTALEATITTYVGEKNNIDVYNNSYRSLIGNAMESLSIARDRRVNAWNVFDGYGSNTTAIQKIANSADQSRNRGRNVSEQEIRAQFQELINNLDLNLAKCRKNVAGARNSINHFGMCDMKSYDELEKILSEEFGNFMKCIHAQV